VCITKQNRIVVHQLKSHKLAHSDIDKLVTSVLRWTQLTARANADIVYSHDTDEYTRPRTEADSDLVRRAATEAITLLKNVDYVLPLESTAETKLKVAVIGANAKARVATGGGSAQCRTSWCQSPWDALIEQNPGNIDLTYSLGGYVSKYLPVLDSSFTRLDGAKGFDLLHYPILPDGTQAPKPAFVDTHDLSDMYMYDFYHPRLGMHYFTELHSIFTSPIDGEYEIGFCITGQGWLWVDDQLVVVNATVEEQVIGTAFLGYGTAEKSAFIQVKKGQVCYLFLSKNNPLTQAAI
jgi:beta-glucosidase